MEAFLAAIPQVGFPIVCAGVMGWFIYKIYTNSTEQNKVNMEQVQARCAEREEKLYEQINRAQEINGQAIATISQYAGKLDVIHEDIKDIKAKLQ